MFRLMSKYDGVSQDRMSSPVDGLTQSRMSKVMTRKERITTLDLMERIADALPAGHAHLRRRSRRAPGALRTVLLPELPPLLQPQRYEDHPDQSDELLPPSPMASVMIPQTTPNAAMNGYSGVRVRSRSDDRPPCGRGALTCATLTGPGAAAIRSARPKVIDRYVERRARPIT
jgi:hypothetical protein